MADQPSNEPTTGEVFRMVGQLREDWNRGNDVLMKLLVNLDIKIDRIEAQTIKTNGRVNGIEKDVYGDKGVTGLIKNVDNLSSRERYVAGALAVIFMLLGLIPFFANLYLHDFVEKEIKSHDVEIASSK